MFEIVLFSALLLCLLVIIACKTVFKSVSQRSIEPWYLDYAKSFFPVLLIVFMLRGFIAEPFRIPSGSMLPTMEVGDFILVSKFSYGVRLPIIFKKVIPISEPKRGDIMVFRYPGDNKTNYIKRVVGLPGDTIEYRNTKRLYINGEFVQNIEQGKYTPFPTRGRKRQLNQYEEQLPGKPHRILLDPKAGSPAVKRTVPDGHYFVLGDNRDHSLDSRYWGFVPDANVVGKAFYIWFHWNSHPGGGVNLDRVGSVE